MSGLLSAYHALRMYSFVFDKHWQNSSARPSLFFVKQLSEKSGVGTIHLTLQYVRTEYQISTYQYGKLSCAVLSLNDPNIRNSEDRRPAQRPSINSRTQPCCLVIPNSIQTFQWKLCKPRLKGIAWERIPSLDSKQGRQ